MRRAFICPDKYVQSAGALNDLGDFIRDYGESAFLIANPQDSERVKKQLENTQEKYGVKIICAAFSGECSRNEVAKLTKEAEKLHCDVIVGLGGGKALDTAKCVANKRKPVIVCPTIAATDAPTSSSSVVYFDDHSFDDYAYFNSPNVVLVDSEVIAKAPVRFLVSGMGDALATYFEARACTRGRTRVNASGHGKENAKSTVSAYRLAEACFKSLLDDGAKAKAACEQKVVTEALENIIETNILMSGLGFESGGLAAAHAIYNGMTVITEAERFMHGEKVAFGTICQLVLENADKEEINTVIDFCIKIGLPVCMKDMGVDEVSDETLQEVADKVCIPEESVHNMWFKVEPSDVVACIKVADALGYEAKYGKKVHTKNI